MSKCKYEKKVKWHDMCGYEKETTVSVQYKGSSDTVIITMDGHDDTYLDIALATGLLELLEKAVEFSCYPHRGLTSQIQKLQQANKELTDLLIKTAGSTHKCKELYEWYCKHGYHIEASKEVEEILERE